jgi:DNA-binding beta-propeller fold protein YncE
MGYRFARSAKLRRLSAIFLCAAILFLSGCTYRAQGGPGGGGPEPVPIPTAATEWFFVDNFSGDFSGFTVQGGKLAPLVGGSVQFPFPVVRGAVDPKGTLLAVLTAQNPTMLGFQTADIGTGGQVSLTKITNAFNNPSVIAISPEGLVAVADTNNHTVQLLMFQNGATFSTDSFQTGLLPQDMVFSPDGKVLFIANNGDNTISVFSAGISALNLLQTVVLPQQPGDFGSGLVRIRLSDQGNKLAASTSDGRVYVADVSLKDGNLAKVQEIAVASGANLEDVELDASGQTVYTADQDNGGIFGYSLSGAVASPLPGSPYPTSVGVTGMVLSGAGDRLYAVNGPAGLILTFTRDKTTGRLTATNDIVSTGGFLADKIVRVPAH